MRNTSTSKKDLRAKSQNKRSKSSRFDGRYVIISEGAPKENQVTEGFKTLLRDLDCFVPEKLKAYLQRLLSNYWTAHNRELSRVDSDSSMKELCSSWKEFYSSLSELFSMLDAKYEQGTDVELSLYSKLGKFLFSDIKGRRLYYLPKEIQALVSDLETGDEKLFSLSLRIFKSRKYLLLMALNVYQLVLNPEARRTLISWIMSLSQYYQLFNYSDQMKREYLNDMIEILTQKEEDPSTDPEYIETFSKLRDIIQGKEKHYLFREWQNAFTLCQPYLASKFTFDDYYVSTHGSSSNGDFAKLIYYDGRKKRKKKIPSIVASAIENDILKDNSIIKEFDNYIGYQSHYNETLPEGFFVPNEIMLIINNPSKYKPRLIHVSSNALQDRANWLRNRLRYLLDHIKPDVSGRQEGMLEFMQAVSVLDFVVKTKSGLYCWDFESATDNSGQKFSEDCLSVYFPKPVVDFWHFLCNMTQEAISPIKGEPRITVTQSSGQPQGNIASFDEFTLSHCHANGMTILLCEKHGMDFKSYNSEAIKKAFKKDILFNISLDMIFRVVGDDNVQDSVIQDKLRPTIWDLQKCSEEGIDSSEFYPLDEDGNWKESFPPGYRTVMEMCHRKVCSWAHLIINDDKSRFNEWNDTEYELGTLNYIAEGIHLSVSNGRVISPIPPRLILGYSDYSKSLSALTWASNRGYNNEFLSSLMEKRIIESAMDKDPLFITVKYLLSRGGFIPQYDCFKNEEIYLSIPDPIKACLKFYALSSVLRSGLIYSYQDDSMTSEGLSHSKIEFRSNLENFSKFHSDIGKEFNFLEQINKYITKDVTDYIEDDQHKLIQLIEHGFDLAESIALLFSGQVDPESIGLIVPYVAQSQYRKAFEDFKRLSILTFENEGECCWINNANSIINFDDSDIRKISAKMKGHSLRRSVTSSSDHIDSIVKKICMDLEIHSGFGLQEQLSPCVDWVSTKFNLG